MNFSLTIPSVFYDLIARVIPGYVLVLLTRLFIPSLYDRVRTVLDVQPAEGFAALASMLGFTVVCYLLGWLLHGAALLMRIEKWGRPKKPEKLFVQYDKVLAENEQLGYRTMKLRAEASMLETCLIASALVGLGKLSELILGANGLRYTAFFLGAVSIIAAYRTAWNRYYGVVESSYEHVTAGRRRDGGGPGATVVTAAPPAAASEP